jgi:hypothetical protein
MTLPKCALTLALLATAFGCEKNRTEIVLGMATDLSASTPLSSVDLQVFSLPDDVLVADQQLPISGTVNELYELPGTYAVYSASGSADRFRALLTATDNNGNTLVVRSAVLSLVPGKTLFARLGVVSACEGMTDCGTGQTCIEGRCASEEIDSSRLPEYRPGMENEVDCASPTTFVDTSTKLPLRVTGTSCGVGEECHEGVCWAASPPDAGTPDGPGAGGVGGLRGGTGGSGASGGNGGAGATAPGPANPAVGTCVQTGSWSDAQGFFGIAPLQDGRILVAGGGNAAVYDPTTGAFTATGSPIAYPGSESFTNGNANELVSLPDGTVLGIGNGPNCQPLAGAELYHPASNTWTATGSMGQARDFELPIALANGQVLVMGGYSQVSSCGHPSGSALTSAEVYDPTTMLFAPTGPMAFPRAAGGEVALLKDGTVFVGVAENGVGQFSTTAEIYTPASTPSAGAFAVAGTLPGSPEYGLAFTLPTGNVLVIGGGTFLFDPSTKTFASGPDDLIGATEPSNGNAGNAGCGVQLKSGDVFLATGLTAQTEVYQASTGTWLQAGTMSSPRSLCAAAELPNGDVLIVGGNNQAGTYLYTADVCNPGGGG